MGRTYLFECPKCGYRTKVAGGTERGFQFAVQTILCSDCKELHDAVIGLKVPAPRIPGDTGAAVPLKNRPKVLKTAPPFVAVLNRLPLPGRMRTRWQSFKAACPVSARHRVREWKTPDLCPKCGVFLEAGALPFRQWE